MKQVVLVGLMGSGKSTIGQIVATDGVAPEAAADIVVNMVASCTAVA